MKKHAFGQKMFTDGRNLGLPFGVCEEKTIYEMGTHWLSGKERDPGAVVSKEGHADSHLGYDFTNELI